MLELLNEIQSRINGELKRGEIVVWAGQPNPTKMMRKVWVTWLFFLPWTAFSLFWIAGASEFKIPDFSAGGFSLFPLFGLPFFLIGIWGLTAPVRAKTNALTIVYVITNLRAFSLEGKKTVKYKTYSSDQLKNLERRQNADGSGDIILGKLRYIETEGNGSVAESGFFAIANVKMVASLLEKLANNTQ